MNDQIVLIKDDDGIENVHTKINNLVIQLNDAIQEESNDEILETLKLLIHHAENHPISINIVVAGYNFIPNLMNLFFSDDIDKSSLVAKFLLKVSYHPNLEITQYFIENEYFVKLLSCLTLIENQEFLQTTLIIIKNIISDFPQAKEIIYSNPLIIDFFSQTITNLSSSKENIKEMIVILSIISDAEIDFEQKRRLLYGSIQCLEDMKYQEFWSLLLDIPSSMIINSEVSAILFEETDILKICQTFIRSDDESLQESAIRCVGNYFLYNSKYICIDFRKIIKCAESQNDELSYISLYLLSNALACGPKMISMIEINGNIYQLLSTYFDTDRKLKCKLEACRAMYSIILQGKKEQIKKAINSNFIYTFVQIIEMQDVSFSSSDGKNLVEEIIKTINFLINIKMIRMSDQNLKKLCIKQFNESRGFEVIDELIQCGIPKVAEAAQAFLNTYHKTYCST